MILDQKSALLTVKKVLTADFACKAGAFDEAGVSICQVKNAAVARRFPRPGKFLAVVSMGQGAVICCSRDRLRWAKNNLSQYSRDGLFSAAAVTCMQDYVAPDNQVMVGPYSKYICTQDTFRPYAIKKGIILIEGEEILRLYPNSQFPNALGHYPNVQRPTVIACVARDNKKIIGAAGASVDCEVMWQLGIDVLPDYRYQGIGRALVSRLTAAVLQKGILPYYTTTVSNIASRRIATSLGYQPTWVEMYSADKPAV